MAEILVISKFKVSYKKWDDFEVKKGTELFRRATSEEEYFNPNEEFISIGKVKAFKTNEEGDRLLGVRVNDTWLNKVDCYNYFTKLAKANFSQAVLQ